MIGGLVQTINKSIDQLDDEFVVNNQSDAKLIELWVKSIHLPISTDYDKTTKTET